MIKQIRFWVVNILLYVFGTAFLKKVRAKLFFARGRVKAHLNDTAYVEKHLDMFIELRKHALSINKQEYADALEECSQIIQRR